MSDPIEPDGGFRRNVTTDDVDPDTEAHGYRKLRATADPEEDTEAHRFRGGAPAQEPIEPGSDGGDADTEGHERR